MTGGSPVRDASDATIVVDAHPVLRHPRRFLLDLVADLRVAIDLAPQMARRQIVARYRRSALGMLWLIITPLSMAAAWIFLRTSRAIPLEGSGTPYAFYVVTGLFLWQGFLRMLNAPLQQVQGARAFVSKMRSPWEAVIAAGWVEVLFEFVVFVGVLLLLAPLLGGTFRVGMLSALIPASGLLLLGGALGLALVPLGLLLDDVPRAVGAGSMLLFFLTPIVYRPSTTRLGTLAMQLNPVAVLLDAARAAVTGDAAAAAWLVVPWMAIACAVFVGGWLLLRVAVPHLVARL